MSLITQCPACYTMFRVVPDQLRISEGWVRCGQCDEVFDANAHLRSLEQPERLEAYQAEQLDGQGHAQTANPLDEPWDWPVVHTPSAEYAPLPQAQPEQQPEQQPQPEYSYGPLPSDEAEPGEPIALSLPAETSDSVETSDPAETSGQAEPGWSSAPNDLAEPSNVLEPGGQGDPVVLGDEPSAQADTPADAQAEPVAADPAPSFLAPEAPPAPAPRWLGTKTLLGLCAMLAAALASQWLWLQRDQLAATSPELRPYLQAACKQLGCNVQPLREIESIAIDSSAFTSVRPGVYLLRVSLKNTGALELATPALELTLTDSQDRPLLRRVLLPAELGDAQAIAAAAELGASIPIAVEPGATPEKIAGYKLLAFYP